MQFLEPKQVSNRRQTLPAVGPVWIAIRVVLWLAIAIPTVTGAERQNPSHSWKLATDDTEVILSIRGGTPVLESLQSTRVRHNWLLTPIKESLVKKVEVGGVSRELDWKFEDADLDVKSGELALHYRNESPRLILDSRWRARPGHGPVEHWSALTNESGQTITVLQPESLALLGLAIPSTKPVQAWWIKRGGGNASTEGGTFHAEANSSFDQVLTSDPTDGSSPVPWMAIQNGEAEGLYVGWEFSGIGTIHARATNPNHFEVHVGLASDFKTDVPAGEYFLVPPAFVGCYHGDLDDGSYTLHRFILEKLLPPLPPDQAYPTLAYNLYLDVGGNKAREQDVMSSARLCKKLGFETFVPDAMWFPKDGDWRWDPARFPRGGQPIEEFTHQNGMKLGLWVAWTHGGDSIDSGALNVFHHPEWFTEKVNPEWKAKDLNWSTLIDLGFDPALDFTLGEVERVVEQNHLDYLKHDYSPIVTKCEQANHRHHYGIDVSYWSTLGYYQIMETVKQRHPNLVLEGCSGGGHIKDFGISSTCTTL